MAKKKQIIRSTFILVIFIYLCLIIYLILTGYNLASIFSAIKKSIIFMIAGFGLGFSIMLVAISGTKNYLLSRALKKNGNGRYGTEAGFLPQVILPKSTKLVIKDDLPTEMVSWLEQLPDDKLAIKDIFLNAAEILKAHLDLPTTSESKVSLYAHSIQVSSKLLEFKNDGILYCKNLVSDKSLLRIEDNELQSLLEILPLLGVLHDLGKIVSSENTSNGIIYSLTHPAKARFITTQLRNFWKLNENHVRAILFALGNYLEPENAPKIKTREMKCTKSIEGLLLIQLLLIAHTKIAPYEKLSIISVAVDSQSAKAPIIENKMEQPLNIDVSTPIMIPKPKPKVIRAPKEQLATVELPGQRVAGRKKNKHNAAQKLDDLFSSTKKFERPQEIKETDVNVNELFSGTEK